MTDVLRLSRTRASGRTLPAEPSHVPAASVTTRPRRLQSPRRPPPSLPPPSGQAPGAPHRHTGSDTIDNIRQRTAKSTLSRDTDTHTTTTNTHTRTHRHMDPARAQT
eukprot:760022-Rhodomonas_salina.1